MNMQIYFYILRRVYARKLALSRGAAEKSLSCSRKLLTDGRRGASILRHIGIKMQSLDSSSIAGLKLKDAGTLARAIRRTSLGMVHSARLGHPGGDFSSADILAVLYSHILRVYPGDPTRPDRDRFILSKGHCSAALYSTLAYSGFFPVKQLDEYMKPLSMLNGHPDRNKVPGVEANTGPLGHGLPIGVGIAKAAKMTDAGWRTFVLTGDGELQEGSNWEAAMAASQFGLDNLTVIVDRNRLQQGAETEETVALEPLAERWRAFGWAVKEVDGHDLQALVDTFRAVPFASGRPSCVIAHTRKGRGVSFMENRVEWHHRVPTAEELAAAFKELEDGQ
jgi:transketolase